MLVTALVENGKGSAPETRLLGERVVRTKEKLRGPDDVALAPSLRNLGGILTRTGEFRSAVDVYERAKAILERARGGDDLELAGVLDDLGHVLTSSERFEDALRVVTRSLAIKEKQLSTADTEIARTLEVEAWLFQRKGDYPRARAALDRALIIGQIANPTPSSFAGTLSLLGEQLRLEGNLQEARDVHRRAISLAETLLGPEHSDLVPYLDREANVLQDLGNFATVLSLRRRALSISEQALGYDRSVGFSLLNDLANVYTDMGDFATARALYERALTSEPREVIVATVVYNLAVLHQRMGDFAEARRQYERAMHIWERVRGPDHPFVARVHISLGAMLTEQGRYAEARAHRARALAIRERSLGPNHPDVARALTGLALTLARSGDLARARAASDRALEIWGRSQATNTTGFASALEGHASVLVDQGDDLGARETYQQALEIREQILGRSHPNVADAQAGLAGVLARLGQTSASFQLALDAEAIGRNHLQLSLRDLPERQALGYAASRPKGLDLALTLASERADLGAAFDAVIRGRALVFDEMAGRHQDPGDAHRPGVEPLRTALTAARQRLANLIVKGPNDQRPQQYTALVDEARREKEQAERALAAVSLAFKDEQARQEVGLDQLRAALPPKSALVAYVRYDRTVLSTTPTPAATSSGAPSTNHGKPRPPVPSYLALVLRADRPDVVKVPLGSASAVDGLVARWRDEATGIARASSLAEAERTYRVAGNALRQRVWDPLAGELSDVARVFVVPDGSLNVISLTALPVGRTQYLIDEGPVIHYLTAERDLVSAPHASAAVGGLLALGGAAFDDATVFGRAPVRTALPAQPARSPLSTQLRASCGDLQSLQFQPLAATSREVRDVAALWTGSPAQVLENRDASERSFKQQAPGHRVLHLATHGFFLGDSCAPAARGTRSVGGLATVRRVQQPVTGLKENPLMLSGLALAGANRRASARADQDDGILTAEEVTSLNLEGVEWAVLSACDTGLGEVRNGEGVFGLRRAFLVAGVHTVIMSLWSVEDEATRVWMKALYEGRLKRQLSTADAVHDASVMVLRQRRAKGLSTHPFYWGSFVAAGDWK